MKPGQARSLVLELSLSAPRAAREHVRLVCAGVVAPRQADEVALVVTELVTNSVRYGQGQINLVLRARRGEVFVAVQDRGAAFVVPPLAADPLREGGRGLPIVAELATGWGILNLGDAGNLVWCVLHARARAARANRAGPGSSFLLGGSDRMDKPGNHRAGLSRTTITA
jgi:anti-sigma regulatory factor (Ser/Thr protein kinase)